jgi:hypothetical protein
MGQQDPERTHRGGALGDGDIRKNLPMTGQGGEQDGGDERFHGGLESERPTDEKEQPENKGVSALVQN